MQGLIVYFSQQGATEKIAKAIANSIESRGINVDLFNLKEKNPPKIDNYDFIGIGSPTYYFRPPFIVTDYLKNLPDIKGKKFFVFVLHGAYKGKTGNVIRKILRKKGGEEVGYFFCKGADIVYLYLKEGYLYSPDSPTEKDVREAEKFGQEVVDFLKDNKKYKIPPFDPDVSSFVFRLERFLSNQWLVKNFYSRFFKVDRKKCTRCGLCIKNCPTKNIKKDKEGYPVWGRNCLSCLMCEMNCPKEAIKCAFDWKIFSPFIKYNLRYYNKDKNLKYIKVKLKNGCIKKV